MACSLRMELLQIRIEQQSCRSSGIARPIGGWGCYILNSSKNNFQAVIASCNFSIHFVIDISIVSCSVGMPSVSAFNLYFSLCFIFLATMNWY
jgi:hypothetical protein